MTQEHPITPPPELVNEWALSLYGYDEAARWGYAQRSLNIEAELQRARDEELRACCKWLAITGWKPADKQLRNARRPKSQGLDKQELRELQELCDMNDVSLADVIGHLSTILHALEQLDD